MNRSDFNEWLSLVGNLSVVAGIIFLGIEVRQNNQLLRAEAASALLDTRMIRNQEVFSNPSVAALLAKNARNELLSDDELIRLQAGYARQLMGWQKDYFLFQEGLLTEDNILTNLLVMKETIDPKAEGTYTHFDLWDEHWKSIAAPDYRNFIESCVLANCDEFPK